MRIRCVFKRERERERQIERVGIFVARAICIKKQKHRDHFIPYSIVYTLIYTQIYVYYFAS